VRGSERRQEVTDQEQKIERLDERVEKLDEPDVEAHKLEKFDRADLGETDETDEPDVEAHRLDKFEPRHDV
jgi:hypothetical protein